MFEAVFFLSDFIVAFEKLYYFCGDRTHAYDL